MTASIVKKSAHVNKPIKCKRKSVQRQAINFWCFLFPVIASLQ